MAGYGFIPVRNTQGGPISVNSLATYTIESGLASNIFRGDVVKIDANSLAVGPGIIIEPAAAGDTMCGVFAGCQYTKTNGEVVYDSYWPTGTAATNIVAYVYDSPWLVFKAQADQDTTPLEAGDAGTNVDMAAGAGGSTVTKMSSQVVNSDTHTTTASGQFRVVGSAQEPGATVWTAAGTTMDVYVMPLEHRALLAVGEDT